MDNKTIKELAVELTVEITAICDEIKGKTQKTYAVNLTSKKIESKIQEEYPNVECELTLKPINETTLESIG